MTATSPVRFGLVGYGAWGSHHARAIAAVEGARLAAIAGRSETSRQQAQADHPGVPVFEDYRQMLDHAELDAVAVVVPSNLHYQIARDVLESGRHLLLEKPMAIALDDCTRLIELAARRGKLLAVGHEMRMSSLWAEVKHQIDAGAIGDPLYILVELWRRPYRLGAGGWRYDIARVGDWILEEPIHFFDLARWYFASCGEPLSVFAQANGKRPERPELHDNFSAMLTFPGGRYAVISQTLAGWEHHQTVKITGTSGALWARWSGANDRTFEPTYSLQLLNDDRPVEVPITRPSGEVYELVEQLEMLVGAVHGQRSLACAGEDGRWSVLMCQRARESLERQAPVSVAGD